MGIELCTNGEPGNATVEVIDDQQWKIRADQPLSIRLSEQTGLDYQLTFHEPESMSLQKKGQPFATGETQIELQPPRPGLYEVTLSHI